MTLDQFDLMLSYLALMVIKEAEFGVHKELPGYSGR